MLACPRCQSLLVKKDDHVGSAGQRYRCRRCQRTFTGRTGTPFAGYRWPRETVVLAVRWYCRYRLSAANVRDLLAEGGIDVSDRTILNWVHTFSSLLAEAARRNSRPVGRNWYCDETYVRVRGRWAYLYRAVDKDGQVVDILLREHRDLASAEAFLAQAIERRGISPTEIITDKHPAYSRAVGGQVPTATHVKTGLHRARGHQTTQPVERSHVPVKDRLRPMRGLQSVATGQRVLEGMAVVQAIQRGDVLTGGEVLPATVTAHEQARHCVATFRWLAEGLQLAS
jgi:predicted Zn finger-like uncharacterized protein